MHCTDGKVPFWKFFRKSQDGRALSVLPSRISKIIFLLGFYEFLAMLEGKIKDTPLLLRFNLVK